MNPKLLLKAGEMLGPEMTEGVGPAMRLVSRLADEALDTMMAPGKTEALKTGDRAFSAMTANPMDRLTNAKFERIRSEGRVLSRWLHDPQEPWSGETKITPDALERMRAAFGQFVTKLKGVRSGTAGERRLLAAHNIFDRELVPAMKDAGIRIASTGNQQAEVQIVYSPPLHPNFRLSSGEQVDLNNVSALARALAEWRDTPIGKSRFFPILPRAAQDADGPVSAYLKVDIHVRGDFDPIFKKLRDPSLEEAVLKGEQPAVPVSYEIAVPDALARGTSREDLLDTAYARFEEGAHLFQVFNEQPLSTMGLRLAQGMQVPGSDLARLSSNPKYHMRRQIFVVENELLGVAQEMAVPLKTDFLKSYDRDADSVMNLAPNPVSAGRAVRRLWSRFDDSNASLDASYEDLRLFSFGDDLLVGSKVRHR